MPDHLKQTLKLITDAFDQWFGIVAGTDAGDVLWLFCSYALNPRDMSTGYAENEIGFTSALTDMIDFIDAMEEATVIEEE
jgi:hypothetical protein